MDAKDLLATRFQAQREQLKRMAQRMLGSPSEAEDAVQEAWLRVAHAGEQIDNLGGWLTTVVGRICLDMLRARKARREEPSETTETLAAADQAERELLMADSVGFAMLVVLDKLNPVERVSFVLHDVFNLPFEEIARIVDRSPAAARQLASRARRRVRGEAEVAADLKRQQEVVGAFLAASRAGDFSALLGLLDPDVVLRADAAAVAAAAARAAAGAPHLAPELQGRAAVAETFKGRAHAASPALVDGYAGLVFAPGGTPRVVFDFVVADGRIVEICLIADPARIASLQLDM